MAHQLSIRVDEIIRLSEEEIPIENDLGNAQLTVL